MKPVETRCLLVGAGDRTSRMALGQALPADTPHLLVSREAQERYSKPHTPELPPGTPEPSLGHASAPHPGTPEPSPGDTPAPHLWDL